MTTHRPATIGEALTYALVDKEPEPAPPKIAAPMTEPAVREPAERDVIEKWHEAASSAEMEPYRPSLMPSVGMWDQITRMAAELAKAVALPAALRNKPADIALVLLTGRDVGIGPTTALNKIYVIDGKPSMAPELMRALIIDRGHDVWFEDVSDTSVTICAHRSTWPADRVTRVTWTMAMAKRANLDGKDVWKKYPRNMLKARATSELGRDDFPDVLLGVSYTPEELDADVDDTGALLRVESEAWTQNAADAPVYQPAPQVVIDAFLAEIERLEAAQPGAMKAISAKWKELRLRPLRPSQHFPQVLAVDEIDLAATAIAQAARETPATAETVESPTDAPNAAQADTGAGTEDPGVAIPRTKAEQAVSDMPPSQVTEALESFTEDALAELPTTEKVQRTVLIELLSARVLCPTCGLLRDGPALIDDTYCGCDAVGKNLPRDTNARTEDVL